MNIKKIIPDQHLLHSQEVAEREFLGQLKISKFSRLALFYWSKLQQNTSKFQKNLIVLFQPLTKQSRSCLPLNKMLRFIALAWFPSPTDQQYHGYTVHRWRGQRHYRVDNVAQARVLKYKINQFIKISAISDFITNQKKRSGSLSSWAIVK